MIEIRRSSMYRRIAWRLMPILLLCYVFAQLNRFNISFAKQQFITDLAIDDASFGLAVSFFYVGYLVFQVPASFLLDRLGFTRFLLCTMAAWGLTGCLMAFARDAGDLYGLRVVLGAAQAGFFPGIILFLGAWFPDGLRGRVNALFTTAVPLGSILAGPLAAMIMGGLDGYYGLRGWQWLFLLEGAPAILLAVVACALLTNRPDSAAWLSDDEKRLLSADEDRTAYGPEGSGRARLASFVRDPRLWLLGLVYFGYFCALNALMVWGPSLLRLAGLLDIQSIGWISGLTALASSAGMILIGMSSDRTRERRWHVALSGLTAAAAFAALILWNGVGATIILLAVAGTGLFAMLGLFWTIPSSYLGTSLASGHIAFINTFGVAGGVLSPYLVGWIAVSTGSLHHALTAIGVVLTAAMTVLLIFVRPSEATGVRAESKAAEPMRH